MVLRTHALLGLGLMLSAGEVPRIAGAFGLDTSTKANLMSAVYTAQAAVQHHPHRGAGSSAEVAQKGKSL